MWLMDADESVAFSPIPPLSHAVEQLACVGWRVGGSAVTGSFLGTVLEQSVRSSRQRR